MSHIIDNPTGPIELDRDYERAKTEALRQSANALDAVITGKSQPWPIEAAQAVEIRDCVIARLMADLGTTMRRYTPAELDLVKEERPLIVRHPNGELDITSGPGS